MAMDILKQLEDELYASSRQTKAVMIYHARKYLEFADGDDPFTRTTVLRYMKHLFDQKYAPNTIRTAGNSIHRLFATAEVKFPLGKKWLPDVTNVDRPSSSEGEIRQMIMTRLAPVESAFLALSTTYGLRREELRRIRKEDIDYEGGTIFIRTCKHGDPRTHILAKQIVPVLKKHSFTKEYDPNTLSQIWHSIEQESGLKHKYSSGWHSIRRYLDTTLLEKAGLENTLVFLRWKTQTSSYMPFHYIEKQSQKVDEEVFKVHPVLPIWEERRRAKY